MAEVADFNAILIVAVENWLWELHDVEYHGVHLINLSKSSRFVSVNHMSERQKTERTRSRRRKPYFIRLGSSNVQTNQKTMWTQLFSRENWFQCVKCLVKWHLSNNSGEKRNVTNPPLTRIETLSCYSSRLHACDIHRTNPHKGPIFVKFAQKKSKQRILPEQMNQCQKVVMNVKILH